MSVSNPRNPFWSGLTGCSGGFCVLFITDVCCTVTACFLGGGGVQSSSSELRMSMTSCTGGAASLAGEVEGPADSGLSTDIASGLVELRDSEGLGSGLLDRAFQEPSGNT